jgi:hypothetical protein
MLVYFMAIRIFGSHRYTLLPFGIFSRFGMFYKDKSGNPGANLTTECQSYHLHSDVSALTYVHMYVDIVTLSSL